MNTAEVCEPVSAMVLHTPIDDLLDTIALALVHEPREVVYGLDRDADIAIATRVSRFAFSRRHTRAGARALVPLIDAAQHHDLRVITGRQLHVLIGIAAADLLERQHLAAFLESYVDPGVPVGYQPVSVTALRRMLHELLTPFEHSRRRAHLLTGLADHTGNELLLRAATSTPFSREFLHSRATHANPKVRAAVASMNSCDEELLRDLANDPDDAVRFSTVWNPVTPSALLDVLADDTDAAVQRGVAEHRNTKTATLTRLASDASSSVLGAIGRNPNTDPQVLASLATHRHPFVRIAVAMNEAANRELLATFADDPHPTVRKSALRNPNMNPDTAVAAPQLSDFASYQPGMRDAVIFHDGTPMRSGDVAPAIARLTVAVSAVRAGARIPVSDVRDVATLPTLEDTPFPTARDAQARLANAPVAVRVLADGHEQRQNGIEMDNCTLAPDKIKECHDGAYIIATFSADGQRYNIAWRHNGTQWVQDGLAGKRNNQAPPRVVALGKTLTPLLEGLEPQAPPVVTTDAALAEVMLTPTVRSRASGRAPLGRA